MAVRIVQEQHHSLEYQSWFSIKSYYTGLSLNTCSSYVSVFASVQKCVGVQERKREKPHLPGLHQEITGKRHLPRKLET